MNEFTDVINLDEHNINILKKAKIFCINLIIKQQYV